MNKVILDASALLALINNEKGAKKVEQLMGSVVMSSINVAEVATRLSAMLSQEECKLAIEPFLQSIINFDANQAYISAYQSTKHKGLSLGDRACIALGVSLNLPVYTCDKVWAELEPNFHLGK